MGPTTRNKVSCAPEPGTNVPPFFEVDAATKRKGYLISDRDTDAAKTGHLSPSRETCTQGSSQGTEADKQGHGATMATGGASPKISDKALRRLVIFGSVGLGVLLITFTVFYYVTQHVNAGPTLTDKSVSMAEAAVKKSPSDIGLRIALAQTYQAANRQDDALGQYNAILKVVPNSSISLLSRAGIYYSQNKFAPAQQDYQTLIGMSTHGQFNGATSQIQSAHYWLAMILFKQGKYAESAAQTKAALQLDQTDSDSWYLSGELAMTGHAPKTAVASFTRALTFVPTGWCQPYDGLVNAYAQLKDTAHEAYYRGELALCQNKNADAKAAFESLTKGPMAAAAMLQLGAMAQASGDGATALTWYQKVLTVEPNDASAKAAIAALKKAGTVAAGTN